MDLKRIRFGSNSSGLVANKLIEIPVLCPNCGVSNNPATTFVGSIDKMAFFKHRCTLCDKFHYSLQEYKSDQGTCRALYPNQQPSNLPPQIVSFSPRFVKMYRDAEFAEDNDSIDLAGIGYRASLEILLKDYALEFKLDSYEEIAQTTLNNAISKYFRTDIDTQSAADVVRILGNDYAHWEQKEDRDIEVLKSYLDIFVQIIKTKLMLKNPPVSRNKKTD